MTGSYDPTAGLITWDISVLDAGQGVLLQLRAPARPDLSDALITMMAALAVAGYLISRHVLPLARTLAR